MTVPIRVRLLLGLLCVSGSVHAALLPDFLLRPVALRYCQTKVAPFASKTNGRALCLCAWDQIARTAGERSAILQEVLHPKIQNQARAHWMAVEHQQIWSCVNQKHLTGALQVAEAKYPKLARWMGR